MRPLTEAVTCARTSHCLHARYQVPWHSVGVLWHSVGVPSSRDPHRSGETRPSDVQAVVGRLSGGVQAWRMRALHFHLVQLVGLHGGGPDPSLAMARARPIPRHLVSRAMQLTKASRAPAAPADAGAGADVAPDEVVLSPMVALMSAPVCVLMQLLGAAPTCDVGAGRDPCRPPVAT